MLDTVVEYCPQAYLPASTAYTHVLLTASYNGVTCSSAMDCYVRYTLAWESPAPTAALDPDGSCVGPPTPSPTATPMTPTPLPSAKAEEEGGGTPAPPGPYGGVVGNGVVNGSTGGVAAAVRDNYLSRAVRCEEVWANCTTLETSVGYYHTDYSSGSGSSSGAQCAKLETVVGQVTRDSWVMFQEGCSWAGCARACVSVYLCISMCVSVYLYLYVRSSVVNYFGHMVLGRRVVGSACIADLGRDSYLFGQLGSDRKNSGQQTNSTLIFLFEELFVNAHFVFLRSKLRNS